MTKLAKKSASEEEIPRGDSLFGPGLRFGSPYLVLLSVARGSGCFSGGDLAFALESPTDFVALRRGASLANGTGNGAFVSAAAAHFFEDALGIELGFQALEGAVYAFSIFEFNSTSVFFHNKNPLGPAGSGKLGGRRGGVKRAF